MDGGAGAPQVAGLGGPGPWGRSLILACRFLRGWGPRRIGASVPRHQAGVSGQRTEPRGRQWATQRFDQPQEHALPGVPGQQAVEDSPAGFDDLAGPDGSARGGTVLNSMRSSCCFCWPRACLPAARRLRQGQGQPGLEAPGQRRHHHVGPVAHQVVHRHPQGLHAALELGDEVLLVAAVVGQQDDLVRRQCRRMLVM